MSTTYRAIHWNRQKRLYDLLVFLLVFVAASTFTSFTIVLHPEATVETILLRGAAFLSIFLIQVLLCIGPLARLNPAFLPLLYNRRHLGITVFLLSSLHAVIVLIQHHALGDTFPLVSLFSSYAHEYREIAAGSSSIRNIPFEPFGALALVVLYLMAVTSHDFWLRTLGPSVWKCLHMLVYPAYAMLLLHVSFGFLQSELHFVYPVFVFSGFALVTMLHLLSAIKGRVSRPRATTRRHS
jgi:methionine sulfoxide reductase heme-binding subunit